MKDPNTLAAIGTLCLVVGVLALAYYSLVDFFRAQRDEELDERERRQQRVDAYVAYMVDETDVEPDVLDGELRTRIAAYRAYC